MASSIASNTTELLVVVSAAMLFVGGLAFYVIQSLLHRDDGDDFESFEELRRIVSAQDHLAVVLPAGASIDALAAGLGFQAVCREFGVTAKLFAEGELTSEDSKTFCNLFDLDPAPVGGADPSISDCDAAVVIGGAGAIPGVASIPVVAVIRHRQLTDESALTITRPEDGATSTTVTELVRRAAFTPNQHVATALLYGIRAGTGEFRRPTGGNDHRAAGYLHSFADLGRVEELHAPSISDESFDVIGDAIINRERRSSFAVTNVGLVPTVSALEEAASTLLRVEGVTTAAVFGVHDETIVISCQTDDVRMNAVDVLEEAFDDTYDVAGNADASLIRVPLGIFSATGISENETLDELIDLSGRKALFDAFESA
ncbi:MULTISPECIES: bifunctional oligoribonuclease/PAP phosphatase NrnA [Halorussus]|uniref:DHH family phosphoesterase n=1 Tax=Halorussus TaxID=1070314 RepID=UPI001F040030|nr:MULTISPECIES: bifunctional oligoribonuclease/PAP phosphatase NrnA [Halorussus]